MIVPNIRPATGAPAFSVLGGGLGPNPNRLQQCALPAGMALHHKLCHTLGGTFNLPHAETHTAVLPHAIAYNSAAAPVAAGRIARALESRSAAAGLYDLAATLGAPTSLESLGLKRE